MLLTTAACAGVGDFEKTTDFVCHASDFLSFIPSPASDSLKCAALQGNSKYTKEEKKKKPDRESAAVC